VAQAREKLNIKKAAETKLFKRGVISEKTGNKVDSMKLIERLEREELQMLERLKLTQRKEVASIKDL